MGSRVRTGGYDQQGSKATSRGTRLTSRDREIALRTHTSEGFERLPDEYLRDTAPNPATAAPRRGQDPGDIRITTNIEQSWDHV